MIHVAEASLDLTESPVEPERLHDHLVHDHGRAPYEIAGLPLAVVHELEHFDDTMGLLNLHHHHGDSHGSAAL